MWFKSKAQKELERIQKSAMQMQKDAVLKDILKRAGAVYQEQSAKYERGNATKRDVATVLLSEGYIKGMVEEAVDYIFK